MGLRGPLPKPTERKRIEGNPGKRPLPTDEPTPSALTEAPIAPHWLPPLAVKAWDHVCDELAAIGMLHRLDLITLETFAVTYHHWRTMTAELADVGYVATFYDDHGNEKYSQPTVQATLAAKYSGELNRLCKVLGIGPAHRVGLRVIEAGGEKKEWDSPVMALLSGEYSSEYNHDDRRDDPQPGTVNGRSTPRTKAAKKSATKKKPTKKAATKKPTKKTKPAAKPEAKRKTKRSS